MRLFYCRDCVTGSALAFIKIMLKRVQTSGDSSRVESYDLSKESTRCNIPEDLNLQDR